MNKYVKIILALYVGFIVGALIGQSKTTFVNPRKPPEEKKSVDGYPSLQGKIFVTNPNGEVTVLNPHNYSIDGERFPISAPPDTEGIWLLSLADGKVIIAASPTGK